MNDKQTVLEAVSRQPETATLAEINEEIATRASIRRGIEAADSGRLKAHEEVKRLVMEWTTK